MGVALFSRGIFHWRNTPREGAIAQKSQCARCERGIQKHPQGALMQKNSRYTTVAWVLAVFQSANPPCLRHRQTVLPLGLTASSLVLASLTSHECEAHLSSLFNLFPKKHSYTTVAWVYSRQIHHRASSLCLLHSPSYLISHRPPHSAGIVLSWSKELLTTRFFFAQNNAHLFRLHVVSLLRVVDHSIQ